jgi:SAM-dependent methyltransferase
MAQKTQRYDRVADQYHRYRPRYPDALISHLTKIVGETSGVDVVVDVGAGTGIFSRQLSAALPSKITIIGIEPSASMRAQAVADASDDAGVAFSDGVAEQLPFDGDRRGRLSRRPQRIGSSARRFTPRLTALWFRPASSPSSNMFPTGRAARSPPH